MLASIVHFVAQTTDIFKKPTGIPDIQATPSLITNVLQLVFGLAGAVALLIVTFAGTKYVLSQGDPQKVAKAKETIIYALVGLVITILAYSIVSFIVTRLA